MRRGAGRRWRGGSSAPLLRTAEKRKRRSRRSAAALDRRNGRRCAAPSPPCALSSGAAGVPPASSWPSSAGSNGCVAAARLEVSVVCVSSVCSFASRSPRASARGSWVRQVGVWLPHRDPCATPVGSSSSPLLDRQGSPAYGQTSPPQVGAFLAHTSVCPYTGGSTVHIE